MLKQIVMENQEQNVQKLPWGSMRIVLMAVVKKISLAYGKKAYEKILSDTGNEDKPLSYKTFYARTKQEHLKVDQVTTFRNLLSDIINQYDVKLLDGFWEAISTYSLEKKGESLKALSDQEAINKLLNSIKVSNPPEVGSKVAGQLSAISFYEGNYIILGKNSADNVSVQPMQIKANGEVIIKTRNNIPYKGEVSYDGSECLSVYLREHMTIKNQFYFSHYLFSVCRVTNFYWAFGVSSRLTQLGRPKAATEILIPLKHTNFSELVFEEIPLENKSIKEIILERTGLQDKANDIEDALEKVYNVLKQGIIRSHKTPFFYISHNSSEKESENLNEGDESGDL